MNKKLHKIKFINRACELNEVNNTGQNHFVKQKSKFLKLELAYVKLRYKTFLGSVSVQRDYTILEREPKEDNEMLNNLFWCAKIQCQIISVLLFSF